jgi:hypothetical protein
MAWFADKGSGRAECEKTRAKKAPPRLRARWGVFDSGMKQVAIFFGLATDVSQPKRAPACSRARKCY